MRQLSWRFYDAQTRKWIQTLDGNRQASLVELTLQIEGTEEPLRSVFWHVNSSSQ